MSIKTCIQTEAFLFGTHVHGCGEKNDNSLEVGKDDERNKEGHDGQAVTHHGHVVETECQLQAEKVLWFIRVYLLKGQKVRQVGLRYLASFFGGGRTKGVVAPHSHAHWVVEPLAVGITHFSDLLC